jgi:hypothetical protein
MSKKLVNFLKIIAAVVGFVATVLSLCTYYENTTIPDIKGKWKLMFTIGHDHPYIGKKFEAKIVIYQDKKRLSGTGKIYNLDGTELSDPQQIPFFLREKFVKENMCFLIMF